MANGSGLRRAMFVSNGYSAPDPKYQKSNVPTPVATPTPRPRDGKKKNGNGRQARPRGFSFGG